MPSKTIPAKACQFAADLDVRATSDDAKTAPITLVARSGQPVSNWFWGNIVHDLGGMSLAKPRIPLDYCHDDNDVIGYANKFDTSTGDLVASGALIPYSGNPEDKATEIIYKAQQGVPYEASIFFDGPLVIEEVGEGAFALVNGQQFTGPLTVVRQWTLRGIAVCPYGNDPNTSAAMKFARGGDIQARVITQEPNQMSATAEAVVTEAVAVEAPATETSETETEASAPAPAVEVTTEVASETEGTSEEDGPAVETATEETAEGQPATTAAPVEATAMSEGLKFLKCFGNQGGVWFAEGKTFAQAQELHLSALSADRDKLAKENAELRGKLAASRGEAEPVSFGADPKERKPEPIANGNLSPALSKFASGIKFRK